MITPLNRTGGESDGCTEITAMGTPRSTRFSTNEVGGGTLSPSVVDVGELEEQLIVGWHGYGRPIVDGATSLRMASETARKRASDLRSSSSRHRARLGLSPPAPGGGRRHARRRCLPERRARS